MGVSQEKEADRPKGPKEPSSSKHPGTCTGTLHCSVQSNRPCLRRKEPFYTRRECWRLQCRLGSSSWTTNGCCTHGEGMMCRVARSILKGKGKGVPGVSKITPGKGCLMGMPCSSQPLPSVSAHPCSLGASGCPGPTGQYNMPGNVPCFPGQGRGTVAHGLWL